MSPARRPPWAHHRAALALLTLALAGLTPGLGAQDWLLVHGPGEGVGSLSWQRIGEVYLKGHGWVAVPAARADQSPATSRLVVATPDQLPGLAAALDLGLTDDGLDLAGLAVPADAGLVLVRPDPDGAGTLAWFTGADDRALFEGFRAPVDLGRQATTVVRDGQRLSPAALVGFGDQLVVERLDRAQARALAAAGPLSDRALSAARALLGHDFVLQAAVDPAVDPFAWHLELFSSRHQELEAAVARFAAVDLEALVADCLARVDNALHTGDQRDPAVFVLLGAADGTNARTFGGDPVSGRRAVLINLTALADVTALETALIHELVHTRQGTGGGRLADRAVQEGVAALVSQRLVEGVDDARALMWSEAALTAARTRHGALVQALREQADLRDTSLLAPWLTLGRPLARVAGAPDRCAYYLGHAAARAWLAADAGRGLADLLVAPADEVLAALE